MFSGRKMITLFVVLFLAAGIATAQDQDRPPVAGKVINEDVYPERRVSFPGGVTGLPDLTYVVRSGFRPLKLDLYLPPTSFAARGPRPFVVYMHGGGWSGGLPRLTGAFENWPNVLASLAAKGYVVASIAYRLQQEAPSPAAIQDVKSAIRWMRVNAAKYNIDKNRGLTWGPSAGGQLSTLAALSCGVAALQPPKATTRSSNTVEIQASAPAGTDAESDCVQAGVGWYGVYNFAGSANEGGTRSNSPYLGCKAAECTDAERNAASPVHYVRPNMPPILLVYGMLDGLAPQSRELYEALKARGNRVEILAFPDVAHSFVGATPELTRNASLKALDTTFAFIDATIGDKK